MIEELNPQSWKGLQDNVCRILNECGYRAESPKRLSVSRGQVEVDVFAVDENASPTISYICECKKWNRRVPLEVVHSFRTVINDSGANIGIIISSKGFQSGAFEVAKNTNVKLFSWLDFQNEFSDRWYANYFMPTLNKINDPLVEYTEPINSRIQRKAEQFNNEKFENFLALRKRYEMLSYFAIGLYAPAFNDKYKRPMLPLDSAAIKVHLEGTCFPEEVLKTNAYRTLLTVLQRSIEDAINEFDELFGERA